MPLANTPTEILPGILQWSAYSPQHKVDLCSSAVRTRSGWWIFDPIPLQDCKPFLDPIPLAGILLTNENHERDSALWASRFHCDRWADPTASDLPPNVLRWSNATQFLGWEGIPLPGGAAGETAFYHPDRSLMVIGDAIVNLPGRGLEILPDRYCKDPAQLRQSLAGLPKFDVALFAHGTPLLENASFAIHRLL